MSLLGVGAVLLLASSSLAWWTSSSESTSRADTSRALGGESSPLNDAYVSTYEIVQEFPHDPTAFTQGLVFDEAGTLYESDGLYQQSAVRKVNVLNGQSTQRTLNPPRVFAEGIQVVGDKLVQGACLAAHTSGCQRLHYARPKGTFVSPVRVR